MNKKILAALGVAVCIAAYTALDAAGKFTYSIHGVTFNTSLNFSAPVKAGDDAMLIVYPRKSDPGKEKMGITMVLYDKNAQKLMGMGDAGLLNYTRSVFMGSANPGKPVERIFAGKKVKGQVVNKKIPVPSTVEVYVITLSNGNKLGIGINYNNEMKTEEARQVITEIGSSLRD